jgi:endogenous inhibitor of DNA gyrase (YacG/DUF329 family)
MVCPICKKSVADEAPARPPTYPFCSDRCKLIDLGRWLDGRYFIPDNAPPVPSETEIPQKDDAS